MRRRFLNSISNDYHSEYFTIEALEDGLTAKLSVNACEYRIDDGNWNTLSVNSNTPSINKGQNLSFRGNLTPSNNNGIGTFTISKKCSIKGNIMSMLYGDDFILKTSLLGKIYAFYNLFKGCINIIDASELILPAIRLDYYCYSNMFYGCTSLTSAPELPAVVLATYCYSSMFQGCTSLTSAPELPATTLTYDCYRYMFQGCSKLNYITMLATDISTENCLYNWVSGVASTGTFTKNINIPSLPSGIDGIPSGWEVKDHITPTECISLTITADDVIGNETTTNIHYTATCNGIDYKGNNVTGFVKEGTAISSEFPQNTSETDTVERTITFEFLGVTASTVITQGVWLNQFYKVDLNNQWELSTTISNPDSSLYDGVYQSFSNKGINNKAAVMYIDICGYTDFDLYIRSYAESIFDYVMVSQLDQTIDNNTSYSNSTLIKAHTQGNQKSGNTISDYTKVSFTGIDERQHRITIAYRKDSSGHIGDDRGYVLLLKNKNTSDKVNLITFTVAGVEYQAEEGMTWGEWVNSEYNVDGYRIFNDMIEKSISGTPHWIFDNTYVVISDLIKSNYSYNLQGAGAGV